MQTETNTTGLLGLAATAIDSTPAVPTVATPASPFSANANTDTARKAAAKRSLAAKTGKRVTVAKAKQPRNVSTKPGKPASPSKPSSERGALIAKLRSGSTYNGPSLTTRGTLRLFPIGDYDTRYASPIQRTDLAHVSPRDDSELIKMLGARTAGFCPSSLNTDRGVFSRLCSVGFIKRGDKAGTYALTPAGAAHARKAAAARKAA